MGLSWAVSALVAVAWPRRARNTTVPSIPTMVLEEPEAILELADWSPQSTISTIPRLVTLTERLALATDPWSRVVEIEDKSASGAFRVPADNSARAYYEWRMVLGLTGDGEEKELYADYLDQCELGKYNPISLIMFGKGLVKCGCEKAPAKIVLPNGKLRCPNIIKWPMQLGMQ